MAEKDLSGLLGGVLQNPAMLSGMLSLLGELSDADEGDSPKENESQKRKALLLAIQPYLGEKRGQTVNRLLQILQVLDSLQSVPAFLSGLKEGDKDETV